MTLVQATEDPQRRQAMIDDGVQQVDDEVAALSGLKGRAIASGYAAVTKVKPQFIRENITRMLPRVAPALDQHVAEADAAGVDVSTHFSNHSNAIADDLLAVTDTRAGEANNALAVKVYNKLRPSAKDRVINAIPQVAAFVERHH